MSADITPFRRVSGNADRAAYQDGTGWWKTFHLRDLRHTYHLPVPTFDTMDAAIAHYREVTA